MVHAKTEGLVNVLLGSDALFEGHNGFVDEGHQETIGDESGDIFGDGNFLTAGLGEGAGSVDDLGASLDGRNELDERHNGDRVEKVDSQSLYNYTHRNDVG